MPINPALLKRLSDMRRLAEAQNPQYHFNAQAGAQDEFSPDASFQYMPRGGGDQMSEDVAFRGGQPVSLPHEDFFKLVRGDSQLPPPSDAMARQTYLRAMTENQPPGVQFGASPLPPAMPGARVSPNPAFGQTQYSVRYDDKGVPPHMLTPDEATATAEGRHMWLEPLDLTNEVGQERARSEASSIQVALDPRAEQARAQARQGATGRLASFLEGLFRR